MSSSNHNSHKSSSSRSHSSSSSRHNYSSNRKRKSNAEMSKGRKILKIIVLIFLIIWVIIGAIALLRQTVFKESTDAETSIHTTEAVSIDYDLSTLTKAPVIEGVKDITVNLGETISYRTGVTVTDPNGEEVTLDIDASRVDKTKGGEYTVIYTATNESGYKSVAECVVTIIEPETESETETEAETTETASQEDIDRMNKLARQVIDEATSDDDSDLYLIYKTYWYIKNRMKFTGSSEKGNYVQAAIEGFETYSGDCYTHFAMMKALLNNMGFETIDIERKPGYDSHHYWNLVWYNNGWYHIDSCPRAVEKDKYWYCFLRTDEELLEWNEKQDDAYGYYDFDSSLYPASATEKLNLGSMQKRD